MPDVTDAGTPVGVVRSVFAGLEALDIDAVLALADPAITYQNVPLPPARGREAFERQMRWFERNVTGFEVRMDNMAAEGAVVLTERTDVISRGRFAAEFWVCGTFEVRDGKVVLWRDRFDFVDVAVAVVKGAVRALLSAARTATGGGDD
jgi:limonene-1,2-epoxide hydrolase